MTAMKGDERLLMRTKLSVSVYIGPERRKKRVEIPCWTSLMKSGGLSLFRVGPRSQPRQIQFSGTRKTFYRPLASERNISSSPPDNSRCSQSKPCQKRPLRFLQPGSNLEFVIDIKRDKSDVLLTRGYARSHCTGPSGSTHCWNVTH